MGFIRFRHFIGSGLSVFIHLSAYMVMDLSVAIPSDGRNVGNNNRAPVKDGQSQSAHNIRATHP